LKAGLIIYGSLDTITGGYLYDRKFVEHLRSRGHRVEIFSQEWRNYAARLKDNFSRVMPASLEKARLDILIEDELNHPSLFLLNRRLRKRVNLPVVSVVHHLRCSELRPDWQNAAYRVVEKDYLSTVDGFVYNSRTTRASVEALVGSGKPSLVAYPGKDNLTADVTAEQVVARAHEPGPLRVLFVGGIIPRKELHTLLAALASVPREEWLLEVVGSPDHDPEYAQRIMKIINDLGLGGRVSLLGSLTGEELARHYSSSHLVAVPSSYEGFGIVYLEGMGFGLPALASRTGAASEIISHDVNGFLINIGDAEAIATHVGDLCRDRDRLVRMSLAAMDRYASHPTWADTAAAIGSFLMEMAH